MVTTLPAAHTKTERRSCIRNRHPEKKPLGAEAHNKPAPGNSVVARQPDDSDAQHKPVVVAHTGNDDEPLLVVA